YLMSSRTSQVGTMPASSSTTTDLLVSVGILADSGLPRSSRDNISLMLMDSTPDSACSLLAALFHTHTPISCWPLASNARLYRSEIVVLPLPATPASTACPPDSEHRWYSPSDCSWDSEKPFSFW